MQNNVNISHRILIQINGCSYTSGIRQNSDYFIWGKSYPRLTTDFSDLALKLVPGRFVPMHFRSRERNDHTVNVRSQERKCGRFVPENETA